MKEDVFYVFYSRNVLNPNYLYVGFTSLPRPKTLLKIQSYLGVDRYRYCLSREVYKLWNHLIPSVSWRDLRLMMSFHPDSPVEPELPFIAENDALTCIEAPY